MGEMNPIRPYLRQKADAMHFPTLVPATLIERNNRFSAAVRLEEGSVASAYVPTTGRLTGVLQPGCRVWLEPVDDPQRKTNFTLVLSELESGGLCSVHAALANRLFAEALQKGGLSAFPYAEIQREVSQAHSRLDFRLSSPQAVCWVEVKSVTYVEKGLGMFPDAPTPRGQRHLETLAQLAAGGAKACAVFIAQRGDAIRFTPFDAVDPSFGETLRRVHRQGVAVRAYRCDVRLEGIEITGEIPVDI
jgi:sugar fermentation stimulation protein A